VTGLDGVLREVAMTSGQRAQVEEKDEVKMRLTSALRGWR
jgi:hypothetical protein